MRDYTTPRVVIGADGSRETVRFRVRGVNGAAAARAASDGKAIREGRHTGRGNRAPLTQSLADYWPRDAS